jgi:hypothetical protein
MPVCFGVHSQIGNRLFDKPQSRSGKIPSNPYLSGGVWLLIEFRSFIIQNKDPWKR